MPLRCYASCFQFGLRSKMHDEFLLSNGAELLEELITYAEGKSKPIRIFSTQELEKATNNYAKDFFMYQDSYYKIYKGTIDGRAIIISKRKRLELFHSKRTYEVAILSQINHANVMKLLGCCLETRIPLLVFEFFPHKRLYQRIHEVGTFHDISWENCLKIATGMAYGITYLHIGTPTPIIHRDIRSRKILLDEDCNVKIVGFDLSVSMPKGESKIKCNVAGTDGYLDPEYALKGELSEKSDVYSYGVVVFEILTGKTAKELHYYDSIFLFVECMEEKRLGFVKANFLKEAKRDQLMAFVQLVGRCLARSWEKRPTMKEVVQELRRIKGL
ncbi:wall-associated receptor kinase-like 1 [Magnolia sinica]|uniref:wall-associated receptor kinase-like 1 n=1 Tax=Magnolia sinica TaxID=86752 RepID=UPI00265830EF|nr:wall-associated receptor kinase-like 1 [Magnolia sinica]